MPESGDRAERKSNRLVLILAVNMTTFVIAALAASLVLDRTDVGANWTATWTMAAGGLIIGVLAVAWWAVRRRRVR